MTCEHCGATLPAFALFCGECGRSVAAPSAVAPVVAPVHPPVLPLVAAGAPVMPDAPAEPAADPVAAPEPAASSPSLLPPCPSCGAVPEPDDRFCADCGVPLPTAATRIIDPIPVPAGLPTPPPAQEALPEPEPEPEAAPAPQTPAQPAVLQEAADESTRLVPRGTGGARFVLQFSTGESYTVLGSGLGGRNPRPEPGEYVDHLVAIVDPGRSVSKTHFEFGQEAGVFWFADRHSGNGSVIREPGAAPRPCLPGHRYAIVRGTRIDIGEQFVIVS